MPKTVDRPAHKTEALPDTYHETNSIDSKQIIDIRVVTDQRTLQEVRDLRKYKYRYVYPDMDLDNDVLDSQALILYTRNTHGRVDSTARLSVDGLHEFPESQYLEEYRSNGYRMMEWGRFAILNQNRKLLKSYYRAVYHLATQLNYDAVIMAMKPRNIAMHQSLIGLRILEEDTKVTYGGPHSLACVSWELDSTKERFFKWIQE